MLRLTFLSHNIWMKAGLSLHSLWERLPLDIKFPARFYTPGMHTGMMDSVSVSTASAAGYFQQLRACSPDDWCALPLSCCLSLLGHVCFNTFSRLRLTHPTPSGEKHICARLHVWHRCPKRKTYRQNTGRFPVCKVWQQWWRGAALRGVLSCSLRKNPWGK